MVLARWVFRWRKKAGMTGIQATIRPMACSAMLIYRKSIWSVAKGSWSGFCGERWGGGFINLRQDGDFLEHDCSIRILGMAKLPREPCKTCPKRTVKGSASSDPINQFRRINSWGLGSGSWRSRNIRSPHRKDRPNPHLPPRSHL